MCGICGAFSPTPALDPAIAAALPAMTATLAARGPDAEGRFADAHAALGHRRLSVVGVADGRQPMSNEDGSIQVVFNGEVYNHRELRAWLHARGHVFRTGSDTEAIVHAYEELGEACVERLRGMFAFALYDARRRELLLARDRLGKKPLYYQVAGGTILFASEIKALRASPAWDGALADEALETYLCLGYLPGEETTYRAVRKLPPATTLRFGAGGAVLRRYWDVEAFDRDARPPAALAADLEARLRESVRLRLEAEVPLGAFLSGGVDSGLVVGCMARERGGDVVATTVGFGGGAEDEVAAARIS
ncbi:MAG TPA: asparagine synthase (glutamine-hydrolyzing), partial [Planctomycetota bacterium]|nr:asparagine synthase (glutamine-hydrolyzing) [Planctomycetota bacterium]